MCLHRVFKGKEKEEALAKLPESGYFYKTVQMRDGSFHSIFHGTRFEAGMNHTDGLYLSGIEYRAAFHIFRHKKDAKTFACGREYIVRCKLKKEHIVAVGIQRRFISSRQEHENLLTIVATDIWMPKCR